MTHCTMIRRQEITHGRLNLSTGALTEDRTETVTQPCATPLFTDQERQARVCRHCANGWSVPENRPATAAEIAAYEAQR